MVTQKTQEEIEILWQGGQILGRIMEELITLVKPGVNILDIDAKAERLILEAGGRPAFKGYQPSSMVKPFPSTICASINEEVVHTPATNRQLQEGDIFTIDIGMQYPAKDGLFTDMAKTVAVGTISSEAQHLLRVTKEALHMGLDIIREGIQLSDISKAIQRHLEKNQVGIVREMVGHGVGYGVHEDPPIPNFYYDGYTDLTLKKGMCLAIEPMATLGKEKIKTGKDGFTVLTKDKSLAAHFEHTVVVLEDKALIVTKIS